MLQESNQKNKKTCRTKLELKEKKEKKIFQRREKRLQNKILLYGEMK